MILIIDNYDSFTYNLAQYIGSLNYTIKIIKNDRIKIKEIDDLNPEKIVISPGPGNPKNAGISINIIKKSKRIAIANKESLICGWGLIQKELKKHKTEIIPVDSEHFSIWSVIKDYQKSVDFANKSLSLIKQDIKNNDKQRGGWHEKQFFSF